jgi:hypothetical protein
MPEWERCKRISAYDWSVPLGTVPLLYFDVYNALFMFENYLRLFVYVALKARHGREWLYRPLGSGPERTGQDTIDSVTKRRIASLRSHSYLGEMSRIPMMYLDFDELAGLVQDERNRDVFQPILHGAVEAFASKLNEMRVIRNNLAHFRKVTDDDFDRLARTIDDIDPAIADYLGEITLDVPYNYLEDASGIGGLQAQAKQWLDGVESFNMEISRSEYWLGVRLTHTVNQKLPSTAEGTECVWVLSSTLLWDSLKKAGVDGSVVFYTSYGRVGRNGDDVVSGSVWVKYVLPWKPHDGAPSPAVESFIRELAGLARQFDQDYRHAGAVAPPSLARVDAGYLNAREAPDPLVSRLCPRNPDTIEDWTGTWEYRGVWSFDRLPWVDELLSRGNEALQEYLGREDGDALGGR